MEERTGARGRGRRGCRRFQFGLSHDAGMNFCEENCAGPHSFGADGGADLIVDVEISSLFCVGVSWRCTHCDDVKDSNSGGVTECRRRNGCNGTCGDFIDFRTLITWPLKLQLGRITATTNI